MKLSLVLIVSLVAVQGNSAAELTDVLEGFPMVLSNWTSCLADLEVQVNSFKQEFESYVNRNNVDCVNHYVFPGNRFGMGYHQAEQFCIFRNQILCNPDDIFPGGVGPVITGEITGEHWSPIRNTYNDWISVGTVTPGVLYITENGAVPPFGLADTETSATSVKGNIYCCPSLV